MPIEPVGEDDNDEHDGSVSERNTTEKSVAARRKKHGDDDSSSPLFPGHIHCCYAVPSPQRTVWRDVSCEIRSSDVSVLFQYDICFVDKFTSTRQWM